MTENIYRRNIIYVTDALDELKIIRREIGINDHERIGYVGLYPLKDKLFSLSTFTDSYIAVRIRCATAYRRIYPLQALLCLCRQREDELEIVPDGAMNAVQQLLVLPILALLPIKTLHQIVDGILRLAEIVVIDMTDGESQ